MDLTSKDISFADRYSCHLCRKWGALCVEIPMDCPIVASGREGLVIAANTYNPSKHRTFRSWAQLKINGAIVSYYREMFGDKNHSESFKNLEFFPFHNNSLELSQNGNSTRVILKDLFNKRLSPGQKHRFLMRYGLRIPTKKIASWEGVSNQAVDIMFHEIKTKIRTILKEIGC